MKSPVFSKSRIENRPNRSREITASVFLLSVTAYFTSSLMTTIGGVIDGFVVGNTMGTAEVGALSLTSPIWFLMSIVYSILAMGCQPLCARELAKGNRENSRRIFSMTVIVGMAATLVLSVLVFVFSGAVTRLLGAEPDMEVYKPCRAYLTGIAFGLPGLALVTLLSVGINLEGARKWTVYSAIVMTGMDILLDILVAGVHGDIFMMGITTSISYISGALVLLLYYLKNKDILLRPKPCRISLRTVGQVSLMGMPMGISRMANAWRSAYINHLLAGSATAAGLAAYNVQVQLNYLTNALFMGIAQATSLIVSLYYAEENRDGMRHTVMIALAYEFFFGLTITFLLRNEAVRPLISRFFLGGNTESHMIANVAIYFFAVGLLGRAISTLFANYLQTTGRPLVANLVYVLCDVALILFFVTWRVALLPDAVGDAILAGTIFSSVSQAQTSMLFVIPLLIWAVNLISRARHGFGWNAALMLPKDFGVPKEQELTDSPRTLEEVADFSQRAYDFCRQQNVGKREAYFVSLAAEEMAGNVIKHGFKDKGYHTLDLRLIRKNNSLILRLRDNSHLFDPVKKLATVADNTDPGAYIGLKMVMKLASDVSYTSTMKLNNLRIRIDLPEKTGTAS